MPLPAPTPLAEDTLPRSPRTTQARAPVRPTHAPGSAVWQPPLEFDGYRLLGPLGHGAVGRVFLAQDTVLDRPVALKLIDAGGLPDAWERERLLVEARAVARLQHPNVVGIYRVGEVEGRPYLASEFVRGRSLDTLEAPLPEAQVVRLGLELARGLAAAHRRGVLHRDLKPANAILADTGEVKLLDFGLAKFVDGPGAEGGEGEGEDADAGETADPEAGWEDAVQGTPAYMAPEVWRGEAAGVAADVYSLGALLYQLCTGRPPHERESFEALRAAVLADAPAPLLGTSPGLSAVVLRCLRKAPSERFPSAEALCDALEALSDARQGQPAPEGNPYRGLLAFEAQHRSLFFGRDAEVRMLLERLRTEPLLLVAGTSGVGKSSLCRAGVLPQVAEGALDRGRPWAVAALTPGRRPLTALACALAPHLGVDEESLFGRLSAEPGEVVRTLRRHARAGHPLCLFVDQLEELATLSAPEEARRAAELLEQLGAPGPGLRVLATCRGDFIARLAALPGLGEVLARGLFLLRPPSPEGVRTAVVGPARAKGVAFGSEEMVDALVASTTRTEGALPLLQFALAELWEARDPERNVIPATALERMGGVEGALARHADAVVAHLPAEQRAAARRLMLALVTLEGTRARRSEAELLELAPGGQAALAALVRGRLLTVGDAPEGAIYEVAHEALLGSWPLLRRWMEEDAERRVVRERLATAASEWERLGRKVDALWGPRQLTEVSLLAREALPERERAFVDASRRAVRRRWVARGALAAAVLAVLGVGLLLARHRGQLEVRLRVDALLARGAASLAEAEAHAARALAQRGEAYAHFDAHRTEAGEAVWTRVREEEARAAAAYQRAGQDAEAALALPGEPETPRALLADVLLARARLAERQHQPVAREELLARLSLYDEGGARQRWWVSPARVQVQSEPAGAAVQLAGPDGEAPRQVGHTPLTLEGLAPGGYTLTLTLSGRPPVRLPLLLTRGELRRVRVPLPARLPQGFAYVPPGRALLGMAGDDGLRRDFFRAAPLHPVEGGAFLVARHETTFGEWLAFLDALPPAERSGHLPRVGSGGFRGALSLHRDAAGWELSMQQGGVPLHARAGESLRIQGRERRASLDWLRLPVVGVSLADAEAYTRWLSRSGRVPGARLCTEEEWERAARGADGREYPHGERLLPEDANFDETYGKRPLAMGPDEVGSHPASTSPFGVEDLAGNVWEWTASRGAEDAAVVRGGSFTFDRSAARSANRELVEATLEDLNLGLRVCADAP